MMAADTYMDDDGMITYTTKIFHLGDAIMGFAGSVSEGLKFKEWYEEGQTDDLDLDDTVVILINSEGIFSYETQHPIIIRDSHFAVGTGRKYAMAAMDHGHSPIEAVKIAMRRDFGTGGEVDFLEL